jgi:hypothetical protein
LLDVQPGKDVIDASVVDNSTPLRSAPPGGGGGGGGGGSGAGGGGGSGGGGGGGGGAAGRDQALPTVEWSALARTSRAAASGNFKTVEFHTFLPVKREVVVMLLKDKESDWGTEPAISRDCVASTACRRCTARWCRRTVARASWYGAAASLSARLLFAVLDPNLNPCVA